MDPTQKYLIALGEFRACAERFATSIVALSVAARDVPDNASNDMASGAIMGVVADALARATVAAPHVAAVFPKGRN